MRVKICYVVSDVDISKLLEANLTFLDAERFRVTTLFLCPEKPRRLDSCVANGLDIRHVRHMGKRDLPRTLWRLFRLFGELRPDIVHTHLFDSSATGLTAAKLRRVKQRIMTRHHSVETHLYHPHAVYYDKYFNKIATHIIAITDVVADVLINNEAVPDEKVSVVHHGFDMQRFEHALALPGDFRKKYGLEENYPVVGVISRFIHWKGLQYVIPAFKELLSKYPNAKLVLANAVGSYEPEVKRFLAEIDPERYCLIRFENEVEKLYKSFDVFVHVPIGREYEAFGQVYVEAPAMRVPSVFTLSGIANDFVKDRTNAMVVPFEDSRSITNAITEILENPQLRNYIVDNAQDSVWEMFSIETMIKGLDQVYMRESGKRES